MSSITIHSGRIDFVDWTTDEIQVNLIDAPEPAVYRLQHGEIVLDDETCSDVPCTTLPCSLNRFTRRDVLDALNSLGLLD